MKEDQFNLICLKSKKLSIEMHNENIIKGYLKWSFDDWIVFDPIGDGGEKDPPQIVINKKYIACIHIIDSPLK